MNVKSRITKVTVYNDRAEVTRSTENELESGEHTLIFDMLPDNLEQNSIQVKGSGNAVLRDVKFKTLYFEEHPDSDLEKLHTEEADIKDRINEIDDLISHSGKEKAFVEKIAEYVTTPGSENQTQEVDPRSWMSLVEFYRGRLTALDKEIRTAEKEKITEENRLNKIRNEINGIAGRYRKQKNQVEVKIEMKEKGISHLDIWYIVYGPSWIPVYNLSVSSDEKKMTISYNAIIHQNTSEDWDDIRIILSTAKPNVSGRQPELAPWYLSLFQPELSPPPIQRMKSASPPMMSQMFEPPEMEIESSEIPGEMEPREASVETGVTSAFFNVNGTNTIKSDNQPYKVPILIHDFPAEFRYSSVPKLAPYAYLKAKVKNNTEFPFLPGETNVFLDGNFVANAFQELVAPTEEFWTFLGIDESISVERKFIKKFKVTEGIISKTTKLRYEYLVILKNKKKTEEEVVIWDQLPISQNEEIKIELIEPVYKKDSPSLKMNEDRFLEWYFKLKPGEEVKIPFLFSVEYPRDSRVTGLI